MHVLPFRHLVTKKIGRETVIFRDMESATGLFRDIFIEKQGYLETNWKQVYLEI